MGRDPKMKKIVSVGLSVVAVTMMTFMMAACSSKDQGAKTVDFSEIGNFTSETSSPDDADVMPLSDAGTAVSADGITVDEWVNSEEAVTFVKAFNTVYAQQGITMELAAENGTLIMILVYSEEALGSDNTGLTDEQKEEVQESMQQQYNEFKEQLISSGNVLKEEVEASRIHIVYKAGDGTELFTQDL